jgi:hypothetical protein
MSDRDFLRSLEHVRSRSGNQVDKGVNAIRVLPKIIFLYQAREILEDVPS